MNTLWVSILFINMRTTWNENEITILENFYPITNDENIVNYFKDRTLTSIKVKAKRLKIYRNNDIKIDNRRNSQSGEKNGMYGKVSKIKGKTYIEVYGDLKSNNIKKILSNNKLGKVGLAGENNGMFGKTPYNKGISPNDEVKKKIKDGIFNYWNNLNEFDTNIRKNKLREEWIIKRNNYSEIDTIPEKITEGLLLKLNIKYEKKINIGYYNCDFVVNNIIIEVQGDYWHGNPNIYNNYDKIQQKNINRDKRKLTYLTLKKYDVLFLWEHDLKHNIIECENLIKSKINE